MSGGEESRDDCFAEVAGYMRDMALSVDAGNYERVHCRKQYIFTLQHC